MNLILWLVCLQVMGLPRLSVIPTGSADEDRRHEAIGKLERFIDHELRDKQLPGISIAVADRDGLIWSDGFGMADPQSGRPATPRTVYRVSWVSEIVTSLAVLKLAEQGKVNLDLPVQTYLPDFHPHNPSGRPITLRMLMCHRAGLPREPAEGGYFDPAAPPLEKVVGSLNNAVLVYEPGSRVKYSNAGVAVLGYLVEKLGGSPFADQIQRSILEPLGMYRSSFKLTPNLRVDLAVGSMRSYDGRQFDPPLFELGTAPANNLYSTVADLGRLVQVLLNGGILAGREVLHPETVREMLRDQFPDSGDVAGLGFPVSYVDGYRTAGHSGSVYGYSTSLRIMPDDGAGVAVAVSSDAAGAVADRIAEYALRLFLAAREGRVLPEIGIPGAVSRDHLGRWEGTYTNGLRNVELTAWKGKLLLDEDAGPRDLREQGDTLCVEDPLAVGKLFVMQNGMMIDGRDTLVRQEMRPPSQIPERWRELLGEYGSEQGTLYILERAGKLTALIEWVDYEPLEEIAEGEWRLPDGGMFAGERLSFERNSSGQVTKVTLNGFSLERREIGLEGDKTFTIKPLRPIDALRREALAARPPREHGNFRSPDLVEVTKLDTSIRLDIRYATTNNFMQTAFYSSARAFLQRPAAQALVRVNRMLHQQGLGLLIHDAYRPWYITKMFWDATPNYQKIYVADPSKGSRHNRGCAVDLTLYDLRTGRPVGMVSSYDEFSPRALPRYPGGTSLQRYYRGLLRNAMEEEGFEVYEWEWWHFDYRDWNKYGIETQTFEELTQTWSN